VLWSLLVSAGACSLFKDSYTDIALYFTLYFTAVLLLCVSYFSRLQSVSEFLLRHFDQGRSDGGIYTPQISLP